MIWSKLLSLCPEAQTHTGSTEKAPQGKDFPPAPKELRAKGGSSALPAPPLPQARPCPCPQPVVTSLVTPHNLSGGWVLPQLLAVAPAITSCIPGAAPASARGQQQAKGALGTSGFTTRHLTSLSWVGCRHSTWGAAQPRSSCFSLLFCFAF